MSSSIPFVGASSSSPPKVQSNMTGRTDIAWKHGVSVDGGTRKIKCNYYAKVLIGGVYRLKHNLAGTQVNVCVCKSIPYEGKVQMWDVVKALQVNHNKKSDDDTNVECVRGKRPV
ncbi:unnamed protein product [Lathyrus oleraceus]